MSNKERAVCAHLWGYDTPERSVMTTGKRLFYIAPACVLSVVCAPLVICIALLILIRDGRPVFYVSERMCAPGLRFVLIKFRTTRAPTINTKTGSHQKSSEPDALEDRSASDGH